MFVGWTVCELRRLHPAHRDESAPGQRCPGRDPGAGLAADVQGRYRCCARDRPGRGGGGSIRLPRAERRRQDDDRADALHAASANRRDRPDRRGRRARRLGRGAPADRRRPAGDRPGSAADRTRAARATVRPVRHHRRGGQGPRRRAARAGRARGGRRSAHKDLLGRDEAAAGLASALVHSPRCCSSTSRPPASIRRRD